MRNFLQIKLNRFILFFVSVLTAFNFIFLFACANSTPEDNIIVIENDFRKEGIWNTGNYEFWNVTTDPDFLGDTGGHEDWGVVTGMTWALTLRVATAISRIR